MQEEAEHVMPSAGASLAMGVPDRARVLKLEQAHLQLQPLGLGQGQGQDLGLGLELRQKLGLGPGREQELGLGQDLGQEQDLGPGLHYDQAQVQGHQHQHIALGQELRLTLQLRPEGKPPLLIPAPDPPQAQLQPEAPQLQRSPLPASMQAQPQPGRPLLQQPPLLTPPLSQLQHEERPDEQHLLTDEDVPLISRLSALKAARLHPKVWTDARSSRLAMPDHML